MPHSHSAFLSQLFRLAALMLLGATVASGQTLRYWDINGSTAGSGSATPSGTWDTSTANWNTSAVGTAATSPWANTGLETAVFAAGLDATGAYTVTLGAGAPLNLSGITVNLGSVTLQPLGASDGLNFGAVNGALTVASSSSLTIAAPVSGSAGLIKSGLGTLTLSGANTFTGATTLTGGSLVLDYTAQNNSKLDAASGLVLGGGILSITPNATTDTAQTVSATALNLGSTTLVVNKNAASNNTTFNLNTITQSSGGTLNIIYGGSGTGTASVTTNNTNTNGILGGWATVNGTSWAVNSTNATNGPVTALTAYVSDTLAAGNNTDITIAGANPAAGALTTNSLRFNQLGAKTLALSTGVKTISSGGILVTANVGAFLTTLSGSNLQAPSGKDLIISQYNPSADLNVTAVIQTAGGGGVVKTGPGVLDLGGANTFTGAVTVDQGFLSVGTVASNGSASNLGAGTLLNLGDSNNLGTLIYTGAAGSTNRGVALGAGGGAVNVTTASSMLTLSGAVSGLGGLTVLGSGGLTLSGPNTFAGATTVQGGAALTLDYTTDTTSKISAASILTLGGGSLTITPNASADTSQTVAGTVLSAGANSVTVTKNATANNATLNLGTLSVSGGATVNFVYGGTGTGTASITTNNANTLTTSLGILGGWATINGTDWAVNSTNAAGGRVTALASYTTTTTGGGTAANYKNQNVDVTSSATMGAAITPYTLRFNTGAAETLTLTGAANTLGSSGLLVTANVGANLSTITGGTLLGPVNGDIDIQQYNTSGALTIASVLGNNTSTRVVKSGPGTVNLTAAETFIGGLVVNQGGVTVTSTLKNVATNAVTINNGGTLTFGVGNVFGAFAVTPLAPVTINAGGTLTNSGAFFNGLGSLTLNGGTLTSAGGLNANFPAWALDGNVTVTGNTTSTISSVGTNGVVALGEAAVSSVTFNVADGAAQTDLLISAPLRNGRDTANTVFQDSSLVKTGAGTMVSSGANTFTGGVTVNAGTLQFTAANLFTGAVTVNGGLLNLGGAMAFTNGATLNGGTLLVTNATALQNVATNTITVNNGGTFIGGNSNLFGAYTVDPVAPLVVAAGGTVTNNGAFSSALGPVTLNGGTLTSTGASSATLPSWSLRGLVTASGATTSTISASGTNSGVALGGADITGATFNVLAGGSAVDLLVSAVLSDGRNSANTAYQPSSLTKTNSGLLQLTAANTYSGATNITAGTLALTSTGSVASTSAINITPGALLDVSAKTGGLVLGSTQTLTGGRSSAFANDLLGSLTSGGTLNPGGDGSAATLTISGGLTLQAGGQIRVDFGTDGTVGGGVNDLISVGGALNASGVTTIVAPASVPVSGVTYELISAGSSGTLTPANFAFGSSGTRQTYTFDTTTLPGAVLLTATGSAANLTWTGAINGIWDLVATTNWSGAVDQTFFNLDNVTFNDTSTVGAVSIPSNVQPLSITVNNSATPYTLAGPGAITGTTGLLKTGTGTLSLSGPNTFSGVVQIQQGVLSVDSVSNAGAASSLGAGSSVILGSASTSGTLQFTTASSGSTNKNITVQAGGGTIAVTDPAGVLAVSGAITGSGSLTKTGAGVLTLSGLNTFSGGLIVSAGTLKAGSPNALGAPAGGATIQSGATLDVNAFNLGTVPVKVAGSGVGGSGAIINSSSTAQAFALQFVSLTGDTTFGGTGNWGIRGTGTANTSSLDLAGFTLTKTGTNDMFFYSTAVTNGNIVVNQGTLSVELGSTIAGTGTITVNPGGTFATGQSGIANTVTRPITLAGGTLANEQNSTVAAPITLATGTASTISNPVANGLYNVTGGVSGPGSVALSLTGTGTATLAFTTAAGNTVGGSFTNNGASVNIGGTGVPATFTVGGPATLNGGTVIFDLSNNITTGNDQIAIGSSLTLSGTTNVQVNVLSGGSLSPTPGSYTLIGGGTSITGGTANLSLNAASIPANIRQTFALDTTTTPGSVLLNVTGSIGNLTWNGPGAWDTNTTANWNNGGVADKFYTWDKVTFDDTSSNGAVSLTSTVTPTSVTVNNNTTNYTISGTGGVIAGFASLLKSGTGTLTLSNANTYAGGSVISAGTVTITAAGALGTGGATLGDVNTGANNVALYLDGTAAVAYTGAIVVSNNGSGTATLGSRSTISASGTGNNFQNITLQRDVIFDSNAVTQTVYEGIKGTGNITVTGNFRTLLLGANTFLGNITVATSGTNAWLQSGSTTAGNTNFIPDTTSITVNSGARYALSSGGETIDALNGAGTVNVNGISGTLTLGGGNGSGSFSGTLANNSSFTLAIVKNGTGTQVFSWASTYTGGTTLNAGTLTLGVDSTLTGSAITQGPLGTGALTLIGGTLSDNGSARTLANAISIGGNVSFSSTGTGSLLFSNGAGNAATLTASPTLTVTNTTTFQQAIGDGGAGLSITKAGAGTLVFTNTNTYSGGTTLNAGTLQLGDGTTNGSAGTGAITDNAALAINNASAQTLASSISGSGTLAVTNAGGTAALTLTGSNSYGGGTTLTAGTLRLGDGTTNGSAGTGAIASSGALIVNNASAQTLVNAISGPGTLAAGGAGVLTLSGSSSYSGGTTIAAGSTVKAGSGTALGSGSLALSGHLDLNGQALAIGTLSGSGGITNGVAGAASISTNVPVLTSTYSGLIQDGVGTVALTTGGAGTLVLNNANTYSGGTTINAGALQLGDGITNGSAGTGAIASSGALVVSNATAQTLVNAISGPGTLAASGAGVLTLSGSSSYSGGTTIALGSTVQAGSGTALGSGAVALSGRLDLNGQALAIGALSGTGGITSGVAGAASMVTTVASGSSLYSGVIQDGAGTVAFAKSGAGTLVLNNANNYSGGTTLNAGTLQLGDGTTNGSVGTGAIVNNGALVISNASAQTIPSSISGTGSLVINGAAPVTLGGTNSYSGATTVGSGSLSVNSLGSGPASIAGGAALNLLTGASTAYANAFSGSGLLKVVFSGGSQTTVDNLGSFTGTIELASTGANGNKWAAGTATVNAASNLVIDSGSQLYLNNGSLTFQSIQVSGTGNTDNRGAIRLQNGTLAGPVSLLGSTTFGAEGGTIAGPISSGANGTQTLTLGGVGNGSIILSGVIGGGTGTLALLSSTTGVTTLAAANTYSGGTTVAAGALLVNNTTGSGTGTGSVRVLNAGTVLGGTGTIAGSTVISSGANLVPGDPAQNSGIGTLAFNNNLTLGASSSIVFQLGASGASEVVVNGLLSLDPASALTVQLDYVPTAAVTFDLLSWQSLSSAASLVSLLNLPVLTGNTFYWDTSTFSTNGEISLDAHPAVPFVQFAVKQARVRKASSDVAIIVAVQLDETSASAVSVPVTLTDAATPPNGTASDFSYSPATVSIPAGSRSASFTVTVHNDGLVEGTETAIFTLSSPTGAVVGSQPTFTLTIDDDLSAQAVGQLWTLRNPLPTNERLNSVAALGTTLAAVGTTGTVLVSNDGGATWTKQLLGVTTNFNAITSNGSEFVAVGDGGAVLTSPDGATWTQRSAGGGESLNGLVWTGSQFVAVGARGFVFTSPNGFDWTLQASNVTASLESVAFANGLLVAVGAGGAVTTSSDGITWSARTSGTTANLNSIASTGSSFIAVGNGGTLLTSANGTVWTPATGSQTLTTANLLFVTWNGSVLIAAGEDGVLLTSASGSAWALGTSGVITDLEGGALAGSQSVLVGSGGTILTSTNATAWTNRSTGATDDLLATNSNGVANISVGVNGSILTSPDGSVWTPVSSPTSQPLNGVASSGSRFVAVGDAGAIATSANNGAAWASITSPVTQNLHGIASSGTAYIGVGDAGTVITSASGLPGSWTIAGATNTTQNLLAVASSGSRWVAVGVGGTIITSADGSAWSNVSQTGVPNLNAAVWTGTQFIVAGSSGTVLTSPDGTAWTLQNSGTSSTISGLAWTGASVFAVTAGGQAISSSDGVTWTPLIVSGNGQPLFAIAWNKPAAVLAAVGSSGTILTTSAVAGPPAPFFPLASQTVAENVGLVRVTVSIGTAPTSAVTVPFIVGGTATGSRYSVSSSPLTFSAGQTSQIIYISINDDAIVEATQNITLTLGAPSGGNAVLGIPNVFTLTLLDKVAPTIVFDPLAQDQIVPLGQPVSLIAAVTGTPAPAVQWLKNGGAVPGATGLTYTIPVVAAANAGKYTATAINAGGTAVTATSAELSVVDTSAHAVSGLAGSKLVLAETAAGDGLTYQWYEVNGSGPDTLLTTGTKYLNATTAALSINALTSTDLGQYYTIVTQAATGLSLKSGNFTVVLDARPTIALSSSPNQNKIVALGQPVSLVAVATGTPAPTVQWSKNAVAVAGATGLTYTLPAAATANAGKYAATATNEAGSTTSAFAEISVIDTSAHAVSGLTGSTLVLAETAAGDGLSYQWYEVGNASPLANPNKYAGVTTASLSIKTLAAGDQGQYYAIVSQAATGLTLQSGSFTVSLAGAPTITLTPSQDQMVPLGQPASFVAADTGTPAPTVQWLKNAAAVAGATSLTYTIPAVATANAGKYTVKATNVAGTVTSTGSAELSVVDTSAHAVSGLANATAVLAETAAGNGLTYQWYEVGNASPLANPNKYVGVTSASLSIKTLAAGDEGQYYVIVSQTATGKSLQSGNFTVALAGAPTITLTPSQDQMVPLGQQASFVATDTGTPAPTVQWLKTAKAVAGATSLTYTIPAVTAANAGKYTVKATNTAGTITSTGSAELSVVDTSAHAVTGLANSTVVLAEAAAGDGLTYQWYEVGNASPLANPTKYAGVTTASLSIKTLAAGDQGQYFVIVSQVATGLALQSGTFTVSLDGAPTITLNPFQNQIVPLGQPVSLGATDTGTPAPTIQWLKNAKAVAGATSLTYTIPAVAAANAGKYTVKATNAAGTATSTGFAELSVIDTSRHVLTGNAGATVVLAETAAGDGLAYQWFEIGSASPLANPTKYAGVTTASLSVKTLASGDQGQYYCVVTQAATGQSLQSGIFSVLVTSKPVVNASQSFPTPWTVSSPYSYQVQYDTTNPQAQPASFTASGLPPGLTINSTTGIISGTPTKAGTYAAVKITGTNAAGTNGAVGPFTLVVNNFASTALGAFVGLIDRTGTATSLLVPATSATTLGARFDLTTTLTGSYSGKVTVGATAYTFNGVLNTVAANPTGSFTIVRAGTSTLTGIFVLDTSTELVSGSISDGTATSPGLSGWHSKWTIAAPTPVVGRHNFIADPTTVPAVDGDQPEGTSYASAVVVAAGTTTVAGFTADGTAIATIAPVGPAGQVLVYQSLYTNTGSLIGTAAIASDSLSGVALHTVSGSLTWSRAAQTAATVRTYKAGWATPINLGVAGGLYHPATGTAIVLDLPTATGSNAQLTFAGGGIDVASHASPDWTSFRINSPASVVVPANNPDAVTLTVNNATGAFNGTFSLSDVVSGVTSKRPGIAFKGLIIPNRTSPHDTDPLAGQGAGFYLLPQLPTTSPATTLATSPILSGQVTLLPLN